MDNATGSMIPMREALQITGKTKPTISRAIHSGKVKAIRQENFSFLIDEGSLRAYFCQAAQPETQPETQPEKKQVAQLSKALNEINALRREIELKDELLKAAKTTQQETSETVKDLRARLDASEEARAIAEETYKRTVNEALAGMNRFMIAARPAEETIIQQQPEETPRGFWSRLFGRGAA